MVASSEAAGEAADEVATPQDSGAEDPEGSVPTQAKGTATAVPKGDINNRTNRSYEGK